MKKIILSALAISCYIFGVAQSNTIVPKIIKNKKWGCSISRISG